MHQEPHQSCACTALRKASRAVTRLYDERLASRGLTATQLAILRNLERQGGKLPLSRLADRLVMDRTSLYRTLAPMERAGWVAVEAGPGRSKLARLTDAGHAAMESAGGEWDRLQDAVIGGLEPGEWQGFMATLNRLIDRAKGSPAP